MIGFQKSKQSQYLPDRSQKCFKIDQTTMDFNPTCNFTVKGAVGLVRDNSLVLLGGSDGPANATTIYGGNE